MTNAALRLGTHAARMEQWRDLHERVNRGRFVTREDVRDLNLARNSFTAHGRSLGWEPRYRGLWVPPGVEWNHSDTARAAKTLLGDEALLTGATALYFDRVIEEPPAAVEVLVDIARSPVKRDGICVHHTSTFADVRYHNRSELRIAAAARAIADHSPHSDVDRLCRIIATASRLRLCTLTQVKQELARRRRFPGRRNLRIALALLTGEMVHSDSERLARRLLRESGNMRPFPRPFPVELDGRPIAEIDVAFPALLYGVEVDGPRHLLPEVASADRSRDRRLTSIGWTIDRFWWDEIEQRQAWFVQEVTAQLARLGGNAPAP